MAGALAKAVLSPDQRPRRLGWTKCESCAIYSPTLAERRDGAVRSRRVGCPHAVFSFDVFETDLFFFSFSRAAIFPPVVFADE